MRENGAGQGWTVSGRGGVDGQSITFITRRSGEGGGRGKSMHPGNLRRPREVRTNCSCQDK